jgi:hypothetical protein
MLEADDDVWEEIRVCFFYSSNSRWSIPILHQNFMKCLMRMFAEEDQGVVFFETVISLKKQKHTCIECVPMPWSQFDLIPGYFKVRMTFWCSPPTYRISGINIVFRG